MNTANVPTALELKYRRTQLALLKSQLSQQFIQVGFASQNGKAINTSAVKLQKDTSVPSPDPYQTLAASFITDLQNQLDTDIVAINAQIAGLTC